MARFYFDFDDSGQHYRDDEGTELADLTSACDEAIGVLRDLAPDALLDKDRRHLATSVRDETGHVVFRAALSFLPERLDGKSH